MLIGLPLKTSCQKSCERKRNKKSNVKLFQPTFRNKITKVNFYLTQCVCNKREEMESDKVEGYVAYGDHTIDI